MFPEIRKKRVASRLFTLALVLGVGTFGLAGCSQGPDNTIRVATGHQSTCFDTYPAGVMVKHLGLLKKYLPHDGKYKGVEYNIVWKDYLSGPPITNQMMAGKLDFGTMGDYPLIINGANFQQTDSLRSLYVVGTGYNLLGSANGLVVPVESDIYSVAQLKGKAISVPVGSAAWGMLYKLFEQSEVLSENNVTIKNQSPPVGATNIKKNKIAAHADFCPWPELIEFRGTGRKIYDGSQTGVPYLHGLVVRKNYAQKYPEIVVAFAKAIIAAGEWVREDPVRASRKLEQWTGIPKEVQYLYWSKGGHLTIDATIKPEWIAALKYDHQVLFELQNIPPLNFETWITDKYVRQAFAELGLNYDKKVEYIRDPRVFNAKLPPEIWFKGQDITRYDSIAAYLKAVAAARAAGREINATYVYDHNIGLKLFGKVAFFVKTGDGTYEVYMSRPDARARAEETGGVVYKLDEAVAAIAEPGEESPGNKPVAAR